MAVRTSQKTGLASDTTVWSGGAVPVEGDSVVIAAGHVVTIENTYIWGDDTVSAIQVSGTLKASRSASSSLTCKGHLVILNGGTFDYGKSGDAIPTSYTHTILLNYSATPVDGKYGLWCADGGNFYVYGKTKTINTTATAQVNSGQAVVTVADTTGWADGDTIVVASTDVYNGTIRSEVRVIATGGISGNNVTVTSNFTYTHLNGVDVGNFTSNVTFKNYSDTYPGFVTLYHANLGSTNTRYLRYASFWNLGSATGTDTLVTIVAVKEGGLNLYSNNSPTATAVYANVSDLAIYRSTSGGICYGYANFGECTPITVNNIAVYVNHGYAFCAQQNCYLQVTNSVSYFTSSYSIYSNYSSGGLNIQFTNCHFICCQGYTVYAGTSFGITLTNCKITSSYYVFAVASSSFINFVNCDFGINYPAVGNNSCNNQNNFSSNNPGITNVTTTNCNFGSITGANFNNQIYGLVGAFQVQNVNKNADVTQQELYLPNGNWIRDNFTYLNSTSSVKLQTVNPGTTTYSITIPTVSGVPVTIMGNLQYNASYRNSGSGYTAPTVTITGLGITPVVFTATVDVGHDATWQPYSLTATQTSGAAGNLTVTISGQSNNASGLVYLDGLVLPPFITNARFYGYTFDETNPLRTVNPYVSASFATASAYTGIAIDWTAKTITLSSNHTMQEIYDYCQAMASTAANLAKTVPMTTADGNTFSLPTNWGFIVNTGITVTATGKKLVMSGTGTYTMTGTGDFTGILADASTTRVKINLSAIVAGSRLQIYDLTSSSELFNNTVAGTTSSLVFIHTGADHSIRIRLMYVSGTTPAYYWHTQTGTVTNTGLSFVATQVENTIYETANVDGSTVTECSISEATIRIYVDDPDNTTTGQRIYNWYQYYLFTAAGIRDQDGTYITATDATHYIFANTMKIINQDTSNPLNLTGANITPVSGAATNIFDLTNGASVCLNFNRVEGFSYSSGSGLSPEEHNALLDQKATIDTNLDMKVSKAKPSLLIDGEIIV